MPSNEYPVAIVGAGPAGTLASLYLSKKGIRHVLIERATFPREKVCGEFYDGRLRKVFNEVDPGLIDRMRADGIVQDIPYYAYYNASMKVLSITCPPEATPRLSTNRALFDDYLLKEACKSPFTTVINANISDYQYTNDAIMLSTKDGDTGIKANIAIVATGTNSVFARKLVPQNVAKGHFLLASRGYYSNVEKENGMNATRVYILKSPVPSYLCLVDLPGGQTTVEVCVLRDIAEKYKLQPDQLLLEVIERHPRIKKLFANANPEGKLKGTSLPSTSSKQPISTERVLLAGSCGGGVNPITGWGVGHAAYEGVAAAKMATKAIEKGDYSKEFLKHYDKHIHKTLSQDRLFGTISDKALEKAHNLTNNLLGIVASNKFLARKTGEFINAI